MSKYRNGELTDQGLDFARRALNGEIKIQFTKGVLSAENHEQDNPQTIHSLTSLNGFCVSNPINYTTPVDNENISVPLRFLNSSMTTNNYVNTVGIYATDGNNEILYSVIINDDPELFPAYNGTTPEAIRINSTTQVGRSDQVNVQVSPQGMVTEEEFQTITNDKDHNFTGKLQHNGIDVVDSNELSNIVSNLGGDSKDHNFTGKLQHNGNDVLSTANKLTQFKGYITSLDQVKDDGYYGVSNNNLGINGFDGYGLITKYSNDTDTFIEAFDNVGGHWFYAGNNWHSYLTSSSKASQFKGYITSLDQVKDDGYYGVSNNNLGINGFDGYGLITKYSNDTDTFIEAFDNTGGHWFYAGNKWHKYATLEDLITPDPAYVHGDLPTTDLHALTTPGTYTSGFGGLQNLPPELSGTYTRYRIVVAKGDNGAGITQTIYTLDGNASSPGDEIWYETYHDGIWHSWQKFANDSNAQMYATNAANQQYQNAVNTAKSYTDSSSQGIKGQMVVDNHDGTISTTNGSFKADAQLLPCDLNTVYVPGIYHSISLPGVYGNCPIPAYSINNNFSLIVTNTGTDVFQEFIISGNYPMYRISHQGSWSAWQSLVSSDSDSHNFTNSLQYNGNNVLSTASKLNQFKGYINSMSDIKDDGYYGVGGASTGIPGFDGYGLIVKWSNDTDTFMEAFDNVGGHWFYAGNNWHSYLKGDSFVNNGYVNLSVGLSDVDNTNYSLNIGISAVYNLSTHQISMSGVLSYTNSSSSGISGDVFFIDSRMLNISSVTIDDFKSSPYNCRLNGNQIVISLNSGNNLTSSYGYQNIDNWLIGVHQ